LTADWILGQFDERQGEAQKRYEQFVRVGVEEPSPVQKLKAQCILGSGALWSHGEKQDGKGPGDSARLFGIRIHLYRNSETFGTPLHNGKQGPKPTFMKPKAYDELTIQGLTANAAISRNLGWKGI
jgi:hypothetical protein